MFALTKRERQIMDVIYRLQRASAADIHAELPDAPTYTTVRGLLRILEAKGHLVHEEDGPRYVYSPSLPRAHVAAWQLAHVVRTFFDGSPAKAMTALLGSPEGKLTEADLEQLSELIERARNADARE
jgi:predicted transcriptional regulator